MHDLLRRMDACLALPTRERRIVFVRRADPWYELYYDGQARAVFKYRDSDGRAVQRILTREQEKEFRRRGPAYVAELYRTAAAGRAPRRGPSSTRRWSSACATTIRT